MGGSASALAVVLVSTLASLLAPVADAAPDPSSATERVPIDRRSRAAVAVVVSEETRALEGWREVVAAIAILERDAPGGVRVIEFAHGDVERAARSLRVVRPDRTVFVARMDEIDASYVRGADRIARAIDADPDVDTSWGILTGRTWERAMRALVVREPIGPVVVDRSTSPAELDDVTRGSLGAGHAWRSSIGFTIDGATTQTSAVIAVPPHSDTRALVTLACDLQEQIDAVGVVLCSEDRNGVRDEPAHRREWNGGSLAAFSRRAQDDPGGARVILFGSPTVELLRSAAEVAPPDSTARASATAPASRDRFEAAIDAVARERPRAADALRAAVVERSLASAITRAPAPDPDAIADAIERLAALDRAAGTAGRAFDETRLGALAWTITQMPTRDFALATAHELVDAIDVAFDARETSALAAAVPIEIHLEWVVPYRHVTERLEPTREMLRAELTPLVANARSREEAVRILNVELWERFGVTYHATRRPLTDQSILESISCGHASCTGLSVMLAEACRAVGIPARVAGVPLWHDDSGNHTWIEVWDDGAGEPGWHFVEAAARDGFDRAWWRENARLARPASAGDSRRAIWAASFARTGARFPLAWDPDGHVVPGIDVTESPRYAGRDTRPSNDE